MQSPQVALDDGQERLLALLRTKNLSVKHLDDAKKAELREFLDYLHNTQGMSLTDLAKLLGNKTSGYTSWVCRQLGVSRRPFEEARLKGIREKRRKYERKPFGGTDEDRAYLLGLRHGDLSVSKPWKGVVRVSTSTTHPAMAELFRSLFEPYGHVYQHPRYKKDTKTYEWNIFTIVDDSFTFLMSTFQEVSEWLLSKASLIRAYLAGFFDAEGSVSIHPARLVTSVNATYYNTDLGLIKFVHFGICSQGFRPQDPYLDKERGFRSPGYHIEMKKDYWRVVIGRFEEAQGFLKILPIRHPEKIQKRELALSIKPGQPWESTAPESERIRSAIRSARDAFVAEAERAYLANPRHRMPAV